MPAVEERVYDFRTAAHWRAGVRRGLQIRGDRLVVPDALSVRAVGGTGSADGGALPAAGGCAGLTWLRPRSRELVRLLDQEQAVAELGVLEGPAPARRLIVGPSLLWVLAGDDVERHDARTLQRLTPAAVPTGWRVRDVTGDGADGVWVVEVGAGGRRLRHIDRWGRTCRDTIGLDGPGGPDSGPAPDSGLAADAGADTSDPAVGERAELSVAAGAAGAWVAVVDPDASTELLVVDTSTAGVTRIPLDPVHRHGRTLLAAGTVVHLLTVVDERSAGVVYQALDPITGDVEDHQVLTLPRGLGRPTSLAVEGTTLVLAGTGGLARLVPAPATEPRRATFITPALVSPLGPVAPWDRAELDLVLPAGTTVEISWATGEPSLAAASLLDGRSRAGAIDELEELLTWRRGATYRGSTDAPERLVDLLDGADGTTLWLRVELRVPAGGPAPELARLRVRYPGTSYLDHLPAIYREDPRGAAELRRLLAPYEMLLDGIDETLDALPARLDPVTADDGWSDYLLGWLGFPPLGELPAHVRRDLLVRAAEILDLRGTRTGLELVLDLVTGGRASVEDSADEPAGWFLGAHAAPSVGAEPARLGADTVAMGQLPRPPRAGALVLGAARLGPTCADPVAMLAHRARTVTITLAVGPDRSQLEPLLDRLLDVLVPAHCRVEVRWTGVGGRRRLGAGLRLAGGPDGDDADDPNTGLADSDDSRLAGADPLGATTRLGRWPLPVTADAPIVLDHATRPGPGPRLQ